LALGFWQTGFYRKGHEGNKKFTVEIAEGAKEVGSAADS
jgi:hypothetical protein